MANIKAKQRDDQIRIRLSKEEKELFYAFAKEMHINSTRLARNIIMKQAVQNLRNKAFYIPIINAYKKYLEITKQNDILESCVMLDFFKIL